MATSTGPLESGRPMIWNTTDDRSLNIPVEVWEDDGSNYVEIQFDNGTKFDVLRSQLTDDTVVGGLPPDEINQR